MKRTLAALVVTVAVLTPNLSSAQSAAQSHEALLKQLIVLLMQQVQLLQEQLANMPDAKAVAERVYEDKEAENQAKAIAEAEVLAAEEKMKEEEAAAALKKKLDAIEKNGYYIECFESGPCVKWISKSCWQEQTKYGTYVGKSCGG